MRIRPFDFSDLDYQAYVDVFNAAHPERVLVVSDVQQIDQTRTKDDVQQRFLAVEEEQVIGVIEYETSFSDPRPDALDVRYRVRPEYKTYTRALWAFLMQELGHTNPRELFTAAGENWEEYPFYLDQGFEEYDRSWPSTLDLSTFDPTPFERPLAEGIHIRALSELPYQQEAFQRQLYKLEVAVLGDVPSVEPFVPWTFEVWRERAQSKNPYFLPEGCFIALEGEQLVGDGGQLVGDGGQLVGLSQLGKMTRPQTLGTGLTGVLRNYRRKGIAMALKLRAAEFAKQYGVRYIRTINLLNNRPMLSINETMGFKKEPAMVWLKKLT